MINIDNRVSESIYQNFIEIYKKDICCYSCHERITYNNKTILDWIDNDIGHELHNCKIDCAICNNLFNRKDSKITT